MPIILQNLTNFCSVVQTEAEGFEAEFSGHILPQWHIYGGYSYIDAKIMDDSNPDVIGKRKENTSKNSVNIWTRYNFFFNY